MGGRRYLTAPGIIKAAYEEKPSPKKGPSVKKSNAKPSKVTASKPSSKKSKANKIKKTAKSN